MNSELPPPVIKNPEALEVSQLQSLFSQAGIDLQGRNLFWVGSNNSCQCYRAVSSEGKCFEINVISFVSEDEKIIFRAFQDWYSAAIRKVSDVTRGYYTFDVLQFEVGDAPWSWSDFSALLTAHAKKLAVDERQIIQFGALWGVLHKRTEAEFGRIESKLQLDFCKPSPEALVRFVKKQMKSVLSEAYPLFVFRDISRTALCQSPSDFDLLKAAFPPQAADATEGKQLVYWHPASKNCLRV